MIKTIDEYWIRYGDPKQSSSFTGSLRGKYLLFSKNQKLLKSICEKEIKCYGFNVAKVSKSCRGGEYVCCIYWQNDRRRFELAERYGNTDEIKYRYWKSNEDTRMRKYSKIHLSYA